MRFIVSLISCRDNNTKQPRLGSASLGQLIGKCFGLPFKPALCVVELLRMVNPGQSVGTWIPFDEFLCTFEIVTGV